MDKRQGECRRLEIPTQVFIHDPEHRQHEALVQIAKDVCRNCPIQLECFMFGMKNGEVGVWGGAWLDLPPESDSSFS